MAYTTFEDIMAQLNAPVARPNLAPSPGTSPQLTKEYWQQQAPLGDYLGDTFSAGMSQLGGLALGALEGLADVADMDSAAEYLRLNRHQVEESIAEQLSSLAPADRLSMQKRFFPGEGEGGSTFADPRSLAGQFMNTLPTIGAGIVPAAIIGIVGFPMAGVVVAGIASGALVGGNIWAEITDRIEAAADEELLKSSQMYREFREQMGMDEAEAKDALGDRVAGLASGGGAAFSALTGGMAARGLTSGITGATVRKFFGKEVAEEGAKATGRSVLGRFGAGTAREALQEASEESVEYGASRYGSEQYGIPTPDITETWQRGLAEAATGGAVYGGPTGGVMETFLGARNGRFLPKFRNVVDDDQAQALGTDAAGRPSTRRGALPGQAELFPDDSALGVIPGQGEFFPDDELGGAVPGAPGAPGQNELFGDEALGARIAPEQAGPLQGALGGLEEPTPIQPDTSSLEYRIGAQKERAGEPMLRMPEQTPEMGRTESVREALLASLFEILGAERAQQALQLYGSRIDKVIELAGPDALTEMVTGRESGEGLGGTVIGEMPNGRKVLLGDVANRAMQFLTGKPLQTLPTAQHTQGGRAERPVKPMGSSEAGTLIGSTSDVAGSTQALEEAFRGDAGGFFGATENTQSLSQLISDTGYVLDREEAIAFAEEEEQFRAEEAEAAAAVEVAEAGAPTTKAKKEKTRLARKGNKLSKQKEAMDKKAMARNARFDEAARAIDAARDNPTDRNMQRAARAIGKLGRFFDKLSPNMLDQLAGAATAGSENFAAAIDALVETAADRRFDVAEQEVEKIRPTGEQQPRVLTEEEVQAREAEAEKRIVTKAKAKRKESAEVTAQRKLGPVKGPEPGEAASEVRRINPKTGKPFATRIKKKAAAAKATSKRRTAAKKAAPKKKAAPRKRTTAAEKAFPELAKAAAAARKPVRKKPAAKKAPTRKQATKAILAGDQAAIAALPAEEQSALFDLVRDIFVKGMTDKATALDFALSEAGVIDREGMQIMMAEAVSEVDAPPVTKADTRINPADQTQEALAALVNKALRSRAKLKPSFPDTEQFREAAAALGYLIEDGKLYAYDKGTKAKPKLGAIPTLVGSIVPPAEYLGKGAKAKATSKRRTVTPTAAEKPALPNIFGRLLGAPLKDNATFQALHKLLMDQQNTEGELTGGTLLQAIIDTTTDRRLLRIAKQLLPVASQRATRYRFSYVGELDEGVSGQHAIRADGSTGVLLSGEVYVNAKPDEMGQFLARDIIHEMLHDLTVSRLDADAKLRSDLRAIMQLLRDDPLVQDIERVEGRKAYAFVDEYEFVAEVFADAGLRKLMHDRPAPGRKKSLLDSFTDAVVKMLRRIGVVRRAADAETLLNQFAKLRIVGSATEIAQADMVMARRFSGATELEKLAGGETRATLASDAGQALGRAAESAVAAGRATRDNMGPTMGATATRIGGALKWNNEFIQRVSGEVAGRGAKWMSAALPTMTRRQIVKAFGHLFEAVGGGNPLVLFQRALSRMDARARGYQAEADKLYVVWEKLRKEHGLSLMERLNRIMTQSTMQGIYFNPTKDPQNDPRNDHLKRVKKDASGKPIKDAAGNTTKEFSSATLELMGDLNTMWETLPDELQQLYESVLQFYKDENAFISHKLLQRVFSTFEMEDVLPSIDNRAAFDKFYADMQKSKALDDPMFEPLGDGGKEVVGRILRLRNRPGPYFPLRRFGDYVVTASRTRLYTHSDKLFAETLRDLQIAHPGLSPTGMEEHTDRHGDTYYTGDLKFYEVAFYESAAEANAFRQEKIADPLYRAADVSGVQLRKNLIADSDSVPSSLLGNIEQQIAKDGRLKTDASKTMVRDVLRSAMLQYLPDASIRHAELRRKNIEGASHDMQRAFAAYALSSSHYKAQLEENQAVAEAFDGAMKVSNELAKGPRADTTDSVKASRVMRELAMRMDRNMVQREPSKWIQFGTDIGFMWYLFNLSYPIINSFQPMMYTLPWLGAKYGNARTMAKMTNVYKVIGGKTVTELGKAAKKMATLKSVTDQFNVIEEFLDNVAHHYGGRNDPRFKRLKRMIDFLGAQGLIDLSFALDLRGGATKMQEELSIGRTNWWGKLQEYSRIMPHLVEIQNRFVTSIAAYELHMEHLAKEKGVPIDKLSEADHDAATGIAEDAVAETQFDYTASNKPRVMNPKNFEPMRLIMMFKQHPQHVYAMMIKYIAMAAGTDPAARSEARKAMLMLFGSHMFFAGALGAIWEPVKWGIGATLAVFGDADDEDFDTLFRNTMAEWFGTSAGEIISRGAPRAVGMDLSGRLGLGNMLFFDTPEASTKGVTSFIGEQVLGPVGGIGAGLFDAINSYQRGDPWRAIEKMTPKGIRDLVRAGRYATQGMLDQNGNVIQNTQELGYTAVFWQALGMAPAAAAEAYEQRGAALGFERRVNKQRSLLLENYYREDRAGRRAIWKDIRAFNRSYPAWKITAETLKRSKGAHARREKERTGAFYVGPKHRAALVKTGEFANF